MATKLTDFVAPVTRCIVCGHEHDRAMGTVDKAPEPGDVSVCSKCGMIAKWDKDFKLVRLTETEMQELKKSKEWELIVRFQKFIDGRP